MLYPASAVTSTSGPHTFDGADIGAPPQITPTLGHSDGELLSICCGNHRGLRVISARPTLAVLTAERIHDPIFSTCEKPYSQIPTLSQEVPLYGA